MSDMLESLAGGAGSAVVGGALGLLGNQVSYNQQKKLMDKSYKQAQEAQRNALVNQKTGMQAAGISTAMLSGTTPTVANGQAPSAPSADIASSAFSAMEAFKQIALMNSEKDLNESNAHNAEANAGYTSGAKTENTNADTTLKHNQNAYQEIINTRENDKDASSARTMLDLAPDACKKFMEEKGWTKEQFIENATIGMLDGLTKPYEATRDVQQARFEFALAQTKQSPVYLNAVKQMGKKQMEQIDALVSNLSHNEKFLDSMAELNKSNTALNDNERKALLQQQQKLVKQQITESVKRGNYLDAMKVKGYVNTATDVVNTVTNIATRGLSGALKSDPPNSSPYLPASPTYGFPNVYSEMHP